MMRMRQEYSAGALGMRMGDDNDVSSETGKSSDGVKDAKEAGNRWRNWTVLMSVERVRRCR